MSITEVRQLPIREKIEMMETLWEDLQSRVDSAPVPEAHRRLLDQRRAAVEAGTEPVEDWESVKKDLLLQE